MLEAKIEALIITNEALRVAIEDLTAHLAYAHAASPLEAKPLEIAPIKVAKPKAAKPAPVEPAHHDGALTIEGLRRAALALSGEANDDTPMTMEELTRAALALSRDGKGDAVRATLTSLGVTRISLLTGDELGAFQRFIKDMGQ
jgi:hypothetical protein